jgi:hypothetical protein
MRLDLSNYSMAWHSRISTMMNLANEAVRELPMPPYAFGIIGFAVLSLLLYLTLRLDRD